MRSASPNITSVTNTTEDWDYYCIELPVGPTVWAGFGVLSGCVGIPASVWLLWVLGQRQRKGVTNDIYMLNLTVMDAIFNFYITPAMLNFLLWKNEMISKVNHVLYCFNISGRPLFMACICVDCFMAVVHPVTYMKMRRSRYRLLPCAAVWGFTLLFGMLFVHNQRLFITSYTGLPYLLSIPTIVVCDLAILHTLRKPDPSRRSDVHPQKQRALQTITTSLVMTLVSYLPVLLVCPFLSLMPATDQVKMCVIIIPVLIAPMLGSIIMPLLHLHGLGSLRGLQQCTRVSGPSGPPAQQP
ncbi:hypothetical protein ACEWY4_026402 [Coilia grayii]|uniref:G-protein coupled receptors family 1 profile domain-containing protein n=1 Tax=Coilia grayii TaxID=363190 RepID=A0ABD1IV55_9TELE